MTHRDVGASPTLSVLVPTHRRPGQISALLDRVLADPDDVEIVVVDDASPDGTADILRGYADRDPRVVPLILEQNVGLSRARYLGAQKATGDVLLMLDDDVMPAPRLAAGHAARHAGRDDLLVLGYMPTDVPDPLPRGAFATLLYAQEYEGRCAEYEADPSLVMSGLWLGNASLRRERFLEPFDRGLVPDFPYRHEDRILGLVLRDLGVEGVFDRTLFAQHQHSRPLDAFLRDAYRNGQGREEIRRLYPDDLPVPSEDYYLKNLPRPVRAVLSTTRHEPVRRVVTGSLRAGIQGATRVGSLRTELALARIVRKVEEWHGARDVER